jgi:anti-sigma regulatory factor (Ser/Thr protein kinase)
MAKNSSHSFALLDKHAHLIDLILVDEKFLDSNPSYFSQVRSQYHQRHISFLVMAKEHGHSTDYLAIESIERLTEILPALMTNAGERESFEYHFGVLEHAHFRFSTLSEGHFLAKYLANQYPKESQPLVGISELFINAIEHGNLEISYDDKSALLAHGRWIEEIDIRSKDPRYKDRFVDVYFTRESDKIILKVCDQGSGFDWKKFEQVDPKRLIASHGRGIMMARGLSFSELRYHGKGNIVEAIYYFESA